MDRKNTMELIFDLLCIVKKIATYTTEHIIQ